MKSYSQKKPLSRSRVNDPARYPTEAAEQMLVFQWAEWMRGKWPELERLYHCPNGGSRNPVEAARLKAQGVKAGVPDLFLPVPRGGYHGLYIEMKRQKGGRVSDDQKDWIAFLTAQGYRTAVCKGAEEAIDELKSYLGDQS